MNLVVNGSMQGSANATLNQDQGSNVKIIISPLGRNFLVAALALTMVVVFVGNVLLLVVLYKQKKTANQRVITMFIANLSVIDLMVSLLVLPISMVTYLYGRWPFGEAFCAVNGFMTMVIGLTGISTMTAIAIDRYRIIVLPVSKRLHPHHACAILAFIWIWAIIQATPPLLGWNKYTFGQSSAICRASFTLRDGYIESLSLISYVIPLITMTYCYVMVYIKVRRSRQRVEMWAQFTQNVWLKAECRTAKIVFTVLSVFVISWTPFIIVYAINGAGKSIVPLTAFRVTGWLASTHSAFNPIIYLYMNQKLRPVLKQLLPFQRESIIERGIEIIAFGDKKAGRKRRGKIEDIHQNRKVT